MKAVETFSLLMRNATGVISGQEISCVEAGRFDNQGSRSLYRYRRGRDVSGFRPDEVD